MVVLGATVELVPGGVIIPGNPVKRLIQLLKWISSAIGDLLCNMYVDMEQNSLTGSSTIPH